MAQQAKNKDNDRSRKDRDSEGHRTEHGSSTGGITATIGSAAETATKAVGSGMESMADQVEKHGPQEGVMGSASTMLSDTLEQAGQYLQREGLSGVAEDLGAMMRRYPVAAVGAGVVLGYLLGCCVPSFSRGSNGS